MIVHAEDLVGAWYWARSRQASGNRCGPPPNPGLSESGRGALRGSSSMKGAFRKRSDQKRLEVPLKGSHLLA